MASRSVRWAEPALADLERIVSFLRERSPKIASTLSRRVDSRVASLSRFPRRGRVVPELQHIGVSRIREIVLGPYRLLYEVEESSVLMVAVFDARRDLEEAIFARLLEIS